VRVDRLPGDRQAEPEAALVRVEPHERRAQRRGLSILLDPGDEPSDW
jgi:hypothetical protein